VGSDAICTHVGIELVKMSAWIRPTVVLVHFT